MSKNNRLCEFVANLKSELLVRNIEGHVEEKIHLYSLVQGEPCWSASAEELTEQGISSKVGRQLCHSHFETSLSIPSGWADV